MAETLGVITSAIQLVDAALKAREYLKDFLNAPQDQRQLFSEMDTLKPLLEELQKRVRAHPSRNNFQHMTAPLNQFKATMEDFIEKLKPTNGRLSRFSKQLAWTLWNKKEAKEYLQEFERVKILLNSWLILDIWDVGQHQQQDTNQILNSINDAVQERKQNHNQIFGIVNDVAQQVLNPTKRDELIEWFSPLNSFPRQAEILSSRQSGTGEWLLEEDRFKAWKSSLGGALWCYGIPGAGKTVLASLVVQHLRTQFQDGNIGVAWIFLNHKETEIQSPSNLLASLWRNLVFNRPIPPAIAALHAQHHEQRTRPSLDEIHSQLSFAVAEHLNVYIIVDALDEYPEDRRGILLESLTKFPTVNLLLTSRPHISIPFPDAQVLEIRATDDDIQCFVKKQLQRSVRLSKHIATRPEFQDEIESKLVHNVEGMFLLAKLHMDSLATKNTIRALRDALNNMPKDIEHTYEDAMDRIDRQSEDDRKVARLVLIWISNAKRPLSIRELQEALAVEPGDTTFDSDNILDADVMLSVCAGLVVIDQTNHLVRLVHYTAQQYLDKVQSNRFPQAQVDITATCLTYLSFTIFKNLPHWHELDPLADWHVLVSQHSLLLYAAEYCLLHAHGQPEVSLKSEILAFLECDFPRFWTFHQHYRGGRDIRHSLTSRTKICVAAAFNLVEITGHLLRVEGGSELNEALLVASDFGALDTVRLLINAGADSNTLAIALAYASEHGYEGIVRLLINNSADVNGIFGQWSTLYVACRQGHESIARILIENGANVNFEPNYSPKDVPDCSPLQATVEAGHAKVVQMLLDNGADIHFMGRSRKSALQIALAKGDEKLIRLLVNHGASANAQDYNDALGAVLQPGREELARFLIDIGANVNAQSEGVGFLEAASAKGAESLVQLLIKKGASVNRLGGYYESALRAAAMEGHESIVRILLDNGARIYYTEGRRYANALEAASREGYENIVRLFIEKGADVNTQAGYGGGALQAAAMKGHEGVVRLLLDNGANMHAPSRYGSALEAASREGYENIVLLLIEKGADVNTQAGYRVGGALQAAAMEGHEGVVRLLLDNGANMHAPSRYGSALEAASREGCENIVRLLIEKGAHVNTQAGHGGGALQAAAMKGHEGVARLLLDNGPNMHAPSRYGSALEAASREGYENIVCLLIEKGADVNTQAGYDGGALQAAAMKGHEGVVRLLLDNGANMHVPSRYGRYGYANALEAASGQGYESIVRLLIEKGADLNTQGGYHGSALQAAARKGYESIVQVLLDNGAKIHARSAIEAAEREGHQNIVHLLESAAEVKWLDIDELIGLDEFETK
ncbi:ankyrin repeat-containing domain protein [Mycena latifolia]|nr:ankyrin repeat-containing domain protein [Mycena latifolia]